MEEFKLLKINDQSVIDSRDVAKMTGKQHKHLMRDIRKYIKDISTSPNLDPSIFFIQDSYRDAKGEIRDCYLLTKEGCEFVANKMTGQKGNLFTAQYVSLFNEYQEMQQKQLNQALSIEELNLRNRELNFKERWLGEMEAQNANKRAELLIKLANHSTKAPLRNDLLNEAMNQLILPVVGEKAFPAGVIADELGVSAYTIGIWGQRLGLKAPHGMRGPYGYWKNNQYFYNEQGVQVLLDHKDEITYGDSDF